MFQLAVNHQYLFSPLFVAFLTLPWLIKSLISSLEFAHILQLEGYKNEGFSKWVETHFSRVFPRREKFFGLLLSFAGLTVGIVDAKKPALLFFFVLWLLIVFLLIFQREKRESKKAFVYTKRAIRLLATYQAVFLLEVIFSFLLLVFASAPTSTSNMVYISRSILFFWLIYFLGILSPYNLMLANILIKPVEEGINAGYFRQAQRKIRKNSKLTVVGITGSYGKTSTKMIAYSVLSTRYPSLTTPESYNTPMGICKVINAERISDYRYFVAEMGARYRGDIRELCDLCPPQIGILTSIGNQHLETFKTLDAIYETKKELADALSPDGILIVNGDDPNCRKVADSTSVKVVRYGLEGEGLDFKADKIETSSQGLRFMVETNQRNSFEVRTRLLGRHNVYNLLAGVALGFVCEIDPLEIASALAGMDPIPHRLQLIQGLGGAIVIDDAYNANPVGAAMALETLAEFKNGQKILVTPGFVEMGAEEDKENREFGKKAAAVCDRVFLVGAEKTKAIRQGLLEAGFLTSKIEVVDQLDQVTQRLGTIVRSGDVILFENDLPDQYS